MIIIKSAIVIEIYYVSLWIEQRGKISLKKYTKWNESLKLYSIEVQEIKKFVGDNVNLGLLCTTNQDSLKYRIIYKWTFLWSQLEDFVVVFVNNVHLKNIYLSLEIILQNINNISCRPLKVPQKHFAATACIGLLFVLYARDLEMALNSNCFFHLFQLLCSVFFLWLKIFSFAYFWCSLFVFNKN